MYKRRIMYTMVFSLLFCSCKVSQNRNVVFPLNLHENTTVMYDSVYNDDLELNFLTIQEITNGKIDCVFQIDYEARGRDRLVSNNRKYFFLRRNDHSEELFDLWLVDLEEKSIGFNRVVTGAYNISDSGRYLCDYLDYRNVNKQIKYLVITDMLYNKKLQRIDLIKEINKKYPKLDKNDLFTVFIDYDSVLKKFVITMDHNGENGPKTFSFSINTEYN